jgi:hypothetical protein
LSLVVVDASESGQLEQWLYVGLSGCSGERVFAQRGNVIPSTTGEIAARIGIPLWVK